MAKFIHKDRQQKGYILLLLFVSPILSLFKILKLKNNKDITFFGTLFFGMIGSLYIYSNGNDGFTHRSLVEQNYSGMSISEFLSQSYDILTFNAGEGTTDFYLHILSFIAGSVFNIPELLHVLAGLVLGYFYTKSVLLIIGDNLQQKKNYILMGLIVLLLLIKSISALNSIRMWTGMWVLFYGTYGWAKTKNIKYFIAILFSMIVHFSYVVIIIPVAISYLIRERKRILVLVYIVSILIISLLTKGYIYGIISSIIATFLFNYFFTAPYYTLLFYDSRYFITFISMTLTSIIVSTLTSRIQLSQNQAYKSWPNGCRIYSHAHSRKEPMRCAAWFHPCRNPETYD
jgi:hypothetical protein